MRATRGHGREPAGARVREVLAVGGPSPGARRAQASRLAALLTALGAAGCAVHVSGVPGPACRAVARVAAGRADLPRVTVEVAPAVAAWRIERTYALQALTVEAGAALTAAVTSAATTGRRGRRPLLTLAVTAAAGELTFDERVTATVSAEVTVRAQGRTLTHATVRGQGTARIEGWFFEVASRVELALDRAIARLLLQLLDEVARCAAGEVEGGVSAPSSVPTSPPAGAPEPDLGEVEAHLAVGDLAAAGAALTRLLERWPGHPLLHQRRAAVALAAGDLDGALADASAAIALAPDRAAPRLIRATVFLQRGARARARTDAQAALERASGRHLRERARVLLRRIEETR